MRIKIFGGTERVLFSQTNISFKFPGNPSNTALKELSDMQEKAVFWLRQTNVLFRDNVVWPEMGIRVESGF
jgi:hypothetical protein